MEKRVHIRYSGSVQGVGFRFTAERVALSLGIVGWVRNTGDGGVEAVCEGNERDIDTFLKRIAGIFKAYIRDADIEDETPTGEFMSFDIRE